MMPLRKKLLQGGGIMNHMNDREKLKNEINVPITQDDFITALKNVNKSVSNNDLKRYEKWMAEFGAT
jgi:katanin p60 ATPase-containing subunit A1